MRQISCPVCNTDPVNSPEPHSICICGSCGVSWTFIPQDVDAAALYTDEVYTVVDNRQSIFERIIFAEAKKVLREAKKLHSNASSLLDFGSGKGQFLAVAKEAGWEGLGIETAVERAIFAEKNYRVKVLTEYYQGGTIHAGHFDLITLNHVLEHLPQPMVFLTELLEKNLAPGGLVYVEVPRANSWQAKIAGKNWMHWDIPKHLTHWTQAGLEKQIEQYGYQKVGSRSLSIHLGILGMVQALLSKLGYRKNLILLLKKQKSLGLIALVAFILPFATLFELISCPFGKSGIFGIYLKKNG